MSESIFRIGLTGGIGSGKSTVAATLLACGAAVVDADAIARQVTLTGGLAINELIHQFGLEVISPDGAMNRDYMRQLVFNDPTVRRRLENIIHPLVNQEANYQLKKAVAADFSCIVFDVPLLVESGCWRQQLDAVWVIDCTESTQIARVMARNNWTQQTVQRVIAEQASRAQRLAAADICIYNQELSLHELVSLVHQVVLQLDLGLEIPAIFSSNKSLRSDINSVPS